MRLTFTLAVLLAATHSLALDCPPPCDCVTGDELEFYCQAGGEHVSLLSRTNEYVNVRCIGSNITCADIPSINLSNNLILPSLGLTDCAPTLLRCLTGALQAASVTSMVVTNASEQLGADDVQDLQELESLMIKSGPEKTVPVDVLNSLINLRNLRITYSNIDLISNAFIDGLPIRFLELSSDKITNLPEDAFNGLKLTILNIWGNNISHVGENSFRGLSTLEELALNTNHITSIAAGAFAHTPRLRLLSLLANALEELPTDLLPNLRDLEKVTIKYNAVELKLQPKCLSNLTSLDTLNLSSSQIRSLPEDLLSSSYNIKTLLLNNNEISSLPEKIFRDQKNLEHLDLSYNKIKELKRTVFGSLRKLKTLNLNRNHLEVVTGGLFDGLTQLKSVSMDNNYITTIYDNSFTGAIGLESLSLNSNKINFKPKPGHYVNNNVISPFNGLSNLKKLYLSRNEIDNIFDDWRFLLLNLEVLDLSWNKFFMILGIEVQFLAQSIAVDLRNNNISTIYLEPLTNLTTNTNLPKSSILLDGNPLNCDCLLYPLALRLKGARPETVEPKLVVGEAKCASPSHLEGKLFSQLSIKELNCDLPENDCKEPCTKCVNRPAFNDIDFDCLNIPNLFPNLSKFGAKYISLKIHKVPNYVGNLTLNLLNVSNIGLKEIPFEPTNNIKVFDFSNNDLKRIPVNFLKGNSQLYLAGNNFECDCWQSNEISQLQKSSSIVQDLDSVTCLNGDKLILVDVVALCSTWRAAAVASGTFIAMVLLVFFIALTIYKYSHEILVYIIDHELFPWCFKEDLIDADKEFDVFISFAHKDRKYLRDLLPKIENEFGQKTCLHYRDWYAGDLIPTQIERSVESSRKTLILLSRNFLESHYANMEFQAAHNLALKQGKTRVILILLEDVTKNEKLSDELKAYMTTNTYLTWDDPRFWERLQKALPRRLTKKFVFPDVFKHNADIKTVSSGLDVHLNSDNKLVNIAVKDV